MILSGIHYFKIWIPDYTLGNDIFLVSLNSFDSFDLIFNPAARRYNSLVDSRTNHNVPSAQTQERNTDNPVICQYLTTLAIGARSALRRS